MARRRNVPAVPEPERLPWERQKGETAAAFHNFALYRDLGPHRSISKVALDRKVNADNLKKQSAKWGWVSRAEAYDDHVDATLREARDTERVRLERAQLGLGSAIVGLALRRINGAAAAMSADGEPIEAVARLDPNEMDAGDVIRAAEVGVRIQRIASGLPTDLIRGSVTVSTVEAQRVVGDVIEILTRFIPPDRESRAYSELQAYIESGRRL